MINMSIFTDYAFTQTMTTMIHVRLARKIQDRLIKSHFSYRTIYSADSREILFSAYIIKWFFSF